MKRRFLLFKIHQSSFYHRPGLRSSHTILLLSSVILFHLISVSCVWCVRHDHHKTTHLEAKVGSYVVFNCYIDFPYDLPIPYVVHWSKDPFETCPNNLNSDFVFNLNYYLIIQIMPLSIQIL
uniref:Uncharacterized protein n=1 Tax=Glossina brevipalpis TaxID=37001 RepID=A0A1A9W0G6_9MUSC